MMPTFFLILLAIFLVFLNGFFVAAEFALVKIRSTRTAALRKKYPFRGRLLARMHHHLDTYLSACQLGITLASLGLGWVGEPAFAQLIKPLCYVLGITAHDVIEAIAFFTAFALISFLHIVLGELAPKSLAIRTAEKVALGIAIPLAAFKSIMWPAIWLLNATALWMLKCFGLTNSHHPINPYSSEELKIILNTSMHHNAMSKDEQKILLRTLDFHELKTADIMRSLDDLMALNVDAPLKANLNIILQSRFSRYPLYEKERENIIGIIHVKDLFAALQAEQLLTDLRQFMRPVLKIPRDMSALSLFQQFRTGTTHLALVINDAERLIGFVTLDNILRALIGHIQDEFHQTRDDWQENADGTLLMKGNAPLFALERALKIDPLPVAVDTLSGLILQHLERLPMLGEKIHFETFDLEVMKLQGPKIALLKVYPLHRQLEA